ncbi:transcription termination factor NusA [Candidatus Bipolaricaulota sp. J31]
MNVDFLEALEEMARERGIEREVAYAAMEKGLAAAYVAEFGGDPPEVVIDRKSGDIYVNGEKFDISRLGRIAMRRAQEVFRQEVLRYRRQMLYDMYASRIGEIVTGTVHRFEGRNVWINLGEAEALLPEKERIPGERYIMGRKIRAYLYRVEKTQGDPRIYVSRAHPDFVVKLLELEVPELEQGLLEVVRVAREPGVRTKLLVRALDPRIDPVGTCIGAGGVRIRMVTRELSGEKVDIIRFSEDPREVIKGALSPASVLTVEIDEVEKKAVVRVPEKDVPQAIGKDGHNVRLAAQLSGYDIEIQPA